MDSNPAARTHAAERPVLLIAAVFLAALCALAALALSPTGHGPVGQAHAKAVATKAKLVNVNGGTHYAVYGKTSSGKTVWKRKCKAVLNSQYRPVDMAKRGKSVYLLDGMRFYRLRLADGKVLAKKKSKAMFAYKSLCVDSKGCFYTVDVGTGSTVYKLTKNGKKVWKAKTRIDGGGAGIKVKGSRLTVSCEFSAHSPCEVYLDTKTGKVTGRSY